MTTSSGPPVRGGCGVLSCFVDESGSPQRSEPRPYRIGFMLTCRPDELASDLRALNRETSPRSKTGRFHVREDESTTRTRLLQLLAIHPEPQLYVVEWRKETFSDRWFRSGRLTVFSDTNLAFGSVALAASEFVSSAAESGFSAVHFSVEATLADTRSEHRGPKASDGSRFARSSSTSPRPFPCATDGCDPVHCTQEGLRASLIRRRLALGLGLQLG